MTPTHARWFFALGLEALIDEIPEVIRAARLALGQNDIATAIFVHGELYKSYTKPREILLADLKGFLSKETAKVFEKPESPSHVPMFIHADGHILAFQYILKSTDGVLS